jgi:hypothetical protein
VSPDHSRPSSTGVEGEQHLTYAQIASRLGITTDAARLLVRRRGWQRIKPNRLGAPAIVIVSDDALDAEDWRDRPSPGVETDPDPASPGVTSGDPGSEAVIALREAVAVLTEALQRAEARADMAVTRADELREAIAVLEARLARSEGALAQVRAHADQETVRADSADADRRAANGRADAATARAEVAESRQRWAEDRVEGLRDLLAETERRAADAEDGRKAVLAHADALERAEFERQGRGLLARLRDALRGA